MKKFFLVYFCLFCFCFGEENIVIRLQWLPQAQFAGYYVAKEKGFYKELDLNVDIKAGGPKINPFRDVLKGDVQFATGLLTTGIKSASSNMPIICVGQIFHKNMLVLVNNKKIKINSLKDLEGKRIGVWSGGIFDLPLRTLLNKEKINAKILEQGYDIKELDNHSLDVASAMLYNEYNMLIENGTKEEDINIINPADYGIKFPEDGIYVSEKYYKENKEIIQKFVKASVKGWNYAINNQKEAVDIVMKEIKTSGVHGSREHQERMLEVISKNIVREDGKVSSDLSKEDFDFVLKTLSENKLTGNKNINYENFYKTSGEF